MVNEITVTNNDENTINLEITNYKNDVNLEFSQSNEAALLFHDSNISAHFNIIQNIKNDIVGINTLLNTKAKADDVVTGLATKADSVTTYTKASTDALLSNKVDNADTTVTKQGNTFNASSQLVKLNSSGQIPALDGSLILNVSKLVPASTTIYVATTGSDSTGDGTSSKPFATIQKAFDSIQGKTLSGDLVIQLADGTYNHTTHLNPEHPQNYLITILGNTTNPSNCVLFFPGNIKAFWISMGRLNIDGVKILGNSSTTSEGIKTWYNGQAFIGPKTIIEGFNIAISATNRGYIWAANVVFNNNNYAALANYGGLIYCPSAVITGNATTKSAAGLFADTAGFIYAGSCSISNCVIGSFANYGSFIRDTAATYTNCTTNRSPASNTLGNNNSYMCT